MSINVGGDEDLDSFGSLLNSFEVHGSASSGKDNKGNADFRRRTEVPRKRSTYHVAASLAMVTTLEAIVVVVAAIRLETRGQGALNRGSHGDKLMD